LTKNGLMKIFDWEIDRPSSKKRSKTGFDFLVGANLVGILYKLGKCISYIRKVSLFFNGGF
jgi:hypothetical protein